MNQIVNNIRILAIESSCDETSAAIIEGTDPPAGGPVIKNNFISSQVDLHKLTNGVVPEIAARAHVEVIIPIIKQALGGEIKDRIKDIDVIAVTFGPGLVGSLLVGVETAKALSFANNKPLIPVNHLEGHIYAALEQRKIQISNTKYQNNSSHATCYMPHDTFPALALIVSGGHTELVLIKGHGQYQIIGETQDDAAGEAFDKVATLMELPYPGGPEISKLAQKVDSSKIKLPRPMITSADFNFSFSGLKTAVVNYVKENPDYLKGELAYEFEQAVVDVLVSKTKKAVLKYQSKTILLTGGVSANKKLREAFTKEFGEKLRLSPLVLTGDNAGMIGLAGWYRFKAGKTIPWQEVNVKPGAELV